MARDLENGTLPALAFNGLWDFVDAANRASLGWIEVQRVQWQPWLDLQAAWLQQCANRNDWFGSAALTQRGTEQLA